jgi:DNA excision repair protein ERCC-6
VEQLVHSLIAKTEFELFEEFFDDQLLEYICDQSKMYATQQNRHGFDLKPFQLQRFIGFLLFTGYHKLPREDMYWENAEDCNVEIVTKAMSRQTFRDIKRNLHLSDNTALQPDDKLFKIRAYVEMLNARFAKYGVFSHNLSIDEQMIPYFGRHSCKMYMKGKPVRFGFKAWCLCSSDGYLFQFMPYTGRDENYDADLGLGASVVMSLLRVVSNPEQHAIYFDNFFTSHKLMIKLHQSHFHATGTVREPRLIASELENSKSFQKRERGAYDFRFDKRNQVLAVKWNDNSVVTLATNFQAVEPVLKANRFSRADRKVVSVTQPNLIASYNANMGGVDLLDNFVAKYRIAVKGKKWWWPLFINYVDVALANAWRLHRLVHGNEV